MVPLVGNCSESPAASTHARAQHSSRGPSLAPSTCRKQARMFQRSQTNLGCAPMGASQPSDSLTTRSCQTHHPSQLRRHPVSGGRGSSSHCSCEACFDVLQLEPHPRSVLRALAQRGSPRSKTVRPLLLRRLRDHTVLQEVDFVCCFFLLHTVNGPLAGSFVEHRSPA